MTQFTFQKKGTYREYTDRHMALRKEQNTLITLSVVPCLLYFLTQQPVFVIIAAMYLTAVFAYVHKRRSSLFNEYTEIEAVQYAVVRQGLKQKGITEAYTEGFGYLSDKKNCEPVYLVHSGDTLYVFRNIFRKECIYGVQGHLLYLLFTIPEKLMYSGNLPVSTLSWNQEKENHQDYLRGEGQRTGRFLVIENFIYEPLLEEMASGKQKKMTNTKYELTRMRNEKIYTTTIMSDRTLAVPEKTLKKMEIPVKGDNE